MTTRNSNAHFDLAPQVGIERSTFDRSFSVKTSFNVGELIPFYVDEILPGDTFEIKTSKVARLQTLITPVMDNLYLDTYYFFVPNRLVWDHWKEFMGENNTDEWIPDVTYTLPQIQPPAGGWNVGTIADYMGIPVGIGPGEPAEGEYYHCVNALPFRAYALICNDWFRDENLQSPAWIYKGDDYVVGVNTGAYVNDISRGGKPFKVNKYHDYFTSCLPAPQKGPDVSFLFGYAPVTGYSNANMKISKDNAGSWKLASLSTGADIGNKILTANNAFNLSQSPVVDGASTTNGAIYFNNVYADLSKTIVQNNGTYNTNTATTINALRQAFQIQRMLEKDARGGTRYIELLKAHFGVTSPDARLQRPEYLGGNRVPFNIEQVLQTSSTDSTSPQGNVSGWSQTNDFSNDVHKSFVEHGFIIGLMCARYDHTYQQGLSCMWKRKNRYDFYWPALAHLGEKPVYEYEIYWDGLNDEDKTVFGYQEAWAEYRYMPNLVTGAMRSAYAQSLDTWHFADYYESAPELSYEWIREDKENVDRTLAVDSSLENQIFIDIYVNNKCTRPMPLYSIPGLIDHF